MDNIDRTFDINVDKILQREKESYQQWIKERKDSSGYYDGVGGR